MKTCKDCGEIKLESLFYGAQNECKECTKSRVKKYRKDNIEKVKQYDRNRPNAKARNETNKARYKENIKDPEYKKKDRARIKVWQEKNHVKRAAHIILGNAKRKGQVTVKPCEVCGEVKAEGHHDDYEKPLEVRWLCRKHHAEHHKNERQIRRINYE